MIAALLILSSTFIFEVGSWVSIVALALYLSFFSLGMGPGCWLIPSEIFSNSIRAKAMSVATFSNRVAGTIMASTFLTFSNTLSWEGYFLSLAIVCSLVGLFFRCFLPETKGRSLEEMTQYFAELTGDKSILEAEQTYHTVLETTDEP